MARTANRDLTQGSPLKLLIGFSLPLLGGFLFQQLYSFVDTAIVGRFLGYDALAAVGSTGSLNFLINGFCMGMCSGFAIPIAQAKGAQDDTELRRLYNQEHDERMQAIRARAGIPVTLFMGVALMGAGLVATFFNMTVSLTLVAAGLVELLVSLAKAPTAVAAAAPTRSDPP